MFIMNTIKCVFSLVNLSTSSKISGVRTWYLLIACLVLCGVCGVDHSLAVLCGWCWPGLAVARWSRSM